MGLDPDKNRLFSRANEGWWARNRGRKRVRALDMRAPRTCTAAQARPRFLGWVE